MSERERVEPLVARIHSEALIRRLRAEAANREMDVDELVRDVLWMWLGQSLSRQRLDVSDFMSNGARATVGLGLEHGDGTYFKAQLSHRRNHEKAAKK
jgi:hypothetical protein